MTITTQLIRDTTVTHKHLDETYTAHIQTTSDGGLQARVNFGLGRQSTVLSGDGEYGRAMARFLRELAEQLEMAPPKRGS